MNEDVYNTRVANLKETLNNLEKNIYNGSIKIENRLDFNNFIRKVRNVMREGTEIYDSILNPISQNQLEEYLEHENEFVFQLIRLLEILENYYNLFNVVAKEDLEKDWYTVTVILKYKNLNKKFNELLKNKDNEETVNFGILSHEINNIEQDYLLGNEQMNQIKQVIKTNPIKENITDSQVYDYAKEAINAIDDLMDKTDSVYNKEFFEDEEKVEEVRVSDAKFDEEYLNSLSSVTAKIEYLELTIANIEHLPGKKITVKCNGKEAKISKYKPNPANWIKCQTELNKYQKQFEEEIALLTNDGTTGTKEDKETYAKICTSLTDVEDKIYELSKEAKPYLNTNQIVSVATLNGSPLNILKTSLPKFNSIFMFYKRLQTEKKSFTEKHGIENIDSKENMKNLISSEKEIFDRINYLENSENEEVTKLKKDLQKITKSKKFAIYANLKELFKKSLVTDKTKEIYIEASDNPEEFIKSKDYSIHDKKQVLSDIIKTYHKKLEDNLHNNIGKVKEDIYTVHENNKYDKLKAVLDNQFSKIRRCFNELPKNLKNTLKISDVREAKNVKKIALYVTGGTAVLSTAFLGINALLNSGSIDNKKENKIAFEVSNDSINKITTSTIKNLEDKTLSSYFNDEESTIYDLNNIFSENSLNNITSNNKTDVNINSLEKNESDSDSKFEEDNNLVNDEISKKEHNWDFGDSFNAIEGSYIHATGEDAYKEENALNPYYSNDSYRTVEGITYEYNGEVITIFSNDPDAIAKQTAIENNGAVQVALVSQNANSDEKGYEGFFNINDVNFIDDIEEGRGM